LTELSDEVFAAFADPTRRLLLKRLHVDNGQTLRQLHTGLSISRQGMAKHLAALEDAGLVVVKRVGHIKLHFIDEAPIRRLMSGWLAAFRVTPSMPVLDPTRNSSQAKQTPGAHMPRGSQHPGRPGARGQGKRAIPSAAALAAANRRMLQDWEKWKKLRDR
jgi:DNA-binding transcriptional ArsR family regulator